MTTRDDPLDPWVVDLYGGSSGPVHPRGPVRARIIVIPRNLPRRLTDTEVDNIGYALRNVFGNLTTQPDGGDVTIDFAPASVRNAPRTDGEPGADADAGTGGNAAQRGSTEATANAEANPEAVAIAVAIADAIAEADATANPDSDTGTYTDAYADTNPDT